MPLLNRFLVQKFSNSSCWSELHEFFAFYFLYEQFNCNSIKKYMHILDQDKCFAGLTYLRIQQHKIYYVPSSLYVTHK